MKEEYISCLYTWRMPIGSSRKYQLLSFAYIKWLINTLTFHINLGNRFDIYNGHFLKTECSKCSPFSVTHSWRHLAKSSIMHCNTSWITSPLLSWVHQKWQAMSWIWNFSDSSSTHSPETEKSGDLWGQFKSQNIDVDTFCAASPYSFEQHVMWHHLAGTTVSRVFPTKLLCMHCAPMGLKISSYCILLIIKWYVFSAGPCVMKVPFKCVPLKVLSKLTAIWLIFTSKHRWLSSLLFVCVCGRVHVAGMCVQSLQLFHQE